MSQVVDGDIVSLACEVEEARLRLQHRWDEVNTRLQMEREVFSAQVSRDLSASSPVSCLRPPHCSNTANKRHFQELSTSNLVGFARYDYERSTKRGAKFFLDPRGAGGGGLNIPLAHILDSSKSMVDIDVKLSVPYSASV